MCSVVLMRKIRSLNITKHFVCFKEEGKSYLSPPKQNLVQYYLTCGIMQPTTRSLLEVLMDYRNLSVVSEARVTHLLIHLRKTTMRKKTRLFKLKTVLLIPPCTLGEEDVLLLVLDMDDTFVYQDNVLSDTSSEGSMEGHDGG